MAVNSKFKILNARELFKSLKNARNEWKLKTPMQKWCYFYGIGRAAYRLIRVSLLNDIHHVHWFVYFALEYFIIIISLSMYTIYYYAIRGQLALGLPSTCSASLFIGHFPLMIVIIFKNRFELQSLIDFGGRYIYHDSHENTEHNRICSNHMDITMRSFIIKMASIYASFAVLLIGPVYAYLENGIHTTTIETHIPFTEPKSTAEFIGNIVLQFVIGMHGFVAYLGLECFLSILENVVTVTPRLIKSELEQTIQLYEEKSITQTELNLKIANIVKQSNDADNYVGTMSELFYWRNLFTPACFTYLIGMAIFCQYMMGFAAGYGLACVSWIQLFYVCEVGENIQDNGFAEMLYQIKWEVLPLNVQKAIMLLIHRKQNEEGLSLGPFGMGINRESFKLVCINDSISSESLLENLLENRVRMTDMRTNFDLFATNKVYTFVMFLKNFFG